MTNIIRNAHLYYHLTNKIRGKIFLFLKKKQTPPNISFIYFTRFVIQCLLFLAENILTVILNRSFFANVCVSIRNQTEKTAYLLWHVSLFPHSA